MDASATQRRVLAECIRSMALPFPDETQGRRPGTGHGRECAGTLAAGGRVMARWRKPDDGPQVPDWIRHECDGGFVPSAWAEPDDFGRPPQAAASLARGRWIAARVGWLNEHLDVAEV